MEPTPFLRGIATVDFSSNAGEPGNKLAGYEISLKLVHLEAEGIVILNPLRLTGPRYLISMIDVQDPNCHSAYCFRPPATFAFCPRFVVWGFQHFWFEIMLSSSMTFRPPYL